MAQYRFVVLIIGGLLLLAADAGAQDLPDSVRPARERLVERFIIGGSSSEDDRRRVAVWELGRGGWPEFITKKVRSPYQWGMRRFWLHNPFGMQSGEVMQFDQFLDAKEARQNILVDRFSESWRPVVDGSLGQPVELICYLGVMDPDDDRMKNLYEEGDPAATLATLLRCIQPVLMSGASIGADAATRLDDEGPAYQFYKFLESIGMPVYVESRPRKDQPGWAKFPVIALDHWWKRSNPDDHPDSAWAMANRDLKTERVRMITDLGTDDDPASIRAMVQRIRAILLEGDTAVFRSRILRENGVTIDDLVVGVDETIARRQARGSKAGSKTRSVREAIGSSPDASRKEPLVTIRRSRGGEAKSQPRGNVLIGPGGSLPKGGRSDP
jgi:hypothetical protein